MVFDFSSILPAITTGAFVAGLLLLCAEMFTGQRLDFALGHHKGPHLVPLALFVRMFAAPALLARHAVESVLNARHIDPVRTFGFATGALGWSFGSGSLALVSFSQLPLFAA